MQLKLKNPLVIFDLETTGTNVCTDRIVEYSFVKVMPDGEIITKTSKIHPTIPIPLESSLIHGIYDEDVKDAPAFKQVAKTLAKFLEGCDLGGYNVVKFDLPMLVEEFLRAGVDFDISNKKFVDAQKIFHLMEKRTLAAAYKFYCNRELEGAHSAEVDTKATFEVLLAQIQKYEGLPVTDNMGNVVGKIENDVEVLHQISSIKMVDLAGRLAYNKNGEEVFNFGKHKDKLVVDVFNIEPSYYDWMMKGDFPLDTKRKLTEIKLRQFNNKIK
jgi:DNA polymerase III subunit epsilon